MAARTATSCGPKAPVGSKAYASPPANTPSAGSSDLLLCCRSSISAPCERRDRSLGALDHRHHVGHVPYALGQPCRRRGRRAQRLVKLSPVVEPAVERDHGNVILELLENAFVGA